MKNKSAVRLLAVVGAICLSILATSCSSSAPPAIHGSVVTTAPSHEALQPPKSQVYNSRSSQHHSHVFVIVMENLAYRVAMSSEPIASLAHRWAYATQYFATTHPSLPNYLSLLGGSTFSISSDCVSCRVNAPNLPTELSSHRLTWSAYMESVPNDCYLSPYAPNGLYAGKHNPFVYFDNIRSTASLCANVHPLSKLETALTNPKANISSFVWITPNLCNDGHNCSPTVAGSWLTSMVSKITSSPAWKANGALYITWDEGNGADKRGLSPNSRVQATGGGGHVLTIVVEPNLPKNLVLSQKFDHYALLKTIETNFGVPELAHSANPELALLP